MLFISGPSTLAIWSLKCAFTVIRHGGMSNRYFIDFKCSEKKAESKIHATVFI